MSTRSSRPFDTEQEAEAASSTYNPVLYSTGPILKDPHTNKYTFTITTWSLD